ncbi:unnamed protein product [Mesocestoides corti]|uniref:glutathione transferase n=1 Tax=Mesocestoides corti TaxID=53468 RepID=A0A3P6GB74_MESCO|nr:unnamed protein product [Mesocestoides corti]
MGQQIRLLLHYCGEKFDQEFYVAGPGKYTSIPASAKERATLLMVHQAAMDIRNAFYRLTFGPDYEVNKIKYLENLPADIKRLSDYLGKRKFFSGEKVNYPDFNIYDLLIVLSTYAPGCLDNYGNLKSYIKRFESIPAIRDYLKSPDYIHRPFTNTMAHWGYYFD